ncbi:hypothetical protein D3C83_77800 [compost metagenome]
MPEVPRVFRVRHGVSLQMKRASFGLLLQHLFDDLHRFAGGVATFQRTLHVLLGQKQHLRSPLS